MTDQSSRKLLVLDVNGLLVATYHKQEQLPPEPHHVKLGNFFVYKRPSCDEFLQFCLKNFLVGIWSSAREHNVKKLVEYVFKDMKHQLAFSWHQTDCTHTGYMHPENKDKPVFLKELSRLWETFKPGEYGPSNTLLVDDSPIKPSGILHIRAGVLRAYLEGLHDALDVQKYVEKNPIGEPSITSSSPLWKFYSCISNLEDCVTSTAKVVESVTNAVTSWNQHTPANNDLQLPSLVRVPERPPSGECNQDICKFPAIGQKVEDKEHVSFSYQQTVVSNKQTAKREGWEHPCQRERKRPWGNPESYDSKVIARQSGSLGVLWPWRNENGMNAKETRESFPSPRDRTGQGAVIHEEAGRHSENHVDAERRYRESSSITKRGRVGRQVSWEPHSNTQPELPCWDGNRWYRGPRGEGGTRSGWVPNVEPVQPGWEALDGSPRGLTRSGWETSSNSQLVQLYGKERESFPAAETGNSREFSCNTQPVEPRWDGQRLSSALGRETGSGCESSSNVQLAQPCWDGKAWGMVPRAGTESSWEPSSNVQLEPPCWDDKAWGMVPRAGTESSWEPNSNIQLEQPCWDRKVWGMVPRAGTESSWEPGSNIRPLQPWRDDKRWSSIWPGDRNGKGCDRRPGKEVGSAVEPSCNAQPVYSWHKFSGNDLGDRNGKGCDRRHGKEVGSALEPSRNAQPPVYPRHNISRNDVSTQFYMTGFEKSRDRHPRGDFNNRFRQAGVESFVPSNGKQGRWDVEYNHGGTNGFRPPPSQRRNSIR